jgi:hypothetical protein
MNGERDVKEGAKVANWRGVGRSPLGTFHHLTAIFTPDLLSYIFYPIYIVSASRVTTPVQIYSSFESLDHTDKTHTESRPRLH